MTSENGRLVAVKIGAQGSGVLSTSAHQCFSVDSQRSGAFRGGRRGRDSLLRFPLLGKTLRDF